MISFRTISLLTITFIAFSVSGQEQADTLNVDLESVYVTKGKISTFLKGSTPQVNVVKMELMQQLPRILGNADPIHYAEFLPGVQTTSIHDAGIYIQGCDNSHSIIGIQGVPLYNPAHMFGLFSIFNTSHFSGMNLKMNADQGEYPNRIGGYVNMMNREKPTKLGGDFSVGPMASQGTIRIPIAKKFALTASARITYLNLLYSGLLKIDDEQIRYSFGDYNLTFQYQPDERNLLWIDGYWGHDKMGYEANDYEMDSHINWSNSMASLHWHHQFDNATLEQKIYYSGYYSKTQVLQTDITAHLSSNIYDLGYQGKFVAKKFDVGFDFIHHTIQPQTPLIDGILTLQNDVAQQRSIETSIFADYDLTWSEIFSSKFSLRGSLYSFDKELFYGIDPGVSLSLKSSANTTFFLDASIKHQYLFKTGFSDIGLPTEFWISASESNRPQYSYNASLSFESFLFDRDYRLSINTYYKRLYNQIEYTGSILDLIYSEYSLDKALLHGKGYNYGINILLEKRKNPVTGWIAFSAGRALRTFPQEGLTGWFPARHERLFELNMVATYRFNPRWSVGGTFVVASGNPYTQAKAIYLMNNNLITEFGEYNGNRLNPYIRLDLSVNYDFKMKGNKTSGINFSLYNATMCKNNVGYRLKLTKKNEIYYQKLSFIPYIIPSINYYFSF